MNYKGVIIEESLKNKDVLNDVTILSTKVEPVVEKHKTPWLKQWTLHTVEISSEKVDEVVKRLAEDLEAEHTSWYADFKNDELHYIIFSGGKIFKVDLKNPLEMYIEAKEYGVSLGIPEYQVNFDVFWEKEKNK